jgi:DNA adenine methylase
LSIDSSLAQPEAKSSRPTRLAASPSPFLKWAGGKRWLVQSRLPRPAGYERFIEPFLGSAAVFFHLKPARALLADVNDELINLYAAIRDAPERMSVLMAWHQEKHSSTHYYQIRDRVYQDRIWRAARTLYLNRTCWNGLYRVNRKGKFNVPMGSKSSVVLPTDDFFATSNMLKNVDLKCQDFEITVDSSCPGDFLFVDPPYTVKHNMNGFVKYNETIFSWNDQVRLAAALERAAARGVAIVVTNADHDSVRSLYQSDFEYTQVTRRSVLAGSAAHRGATTEALFTRNLE